MNKEKIITPIYDNIIYISHPYGGIKLNEDRVAEIILKLQKQYPDYLFVSPIHAFSFEYTYDDYETGINKCLWLLDRCSEMWVYGDWENSKGCKIEIQFCDYNCIPYTIMNI